MKAALPADRWAAWKSDIRSMADALPGKSELMPEVIAGLEIPAVEQRFEVDGADHARKFLVNRGFPAAAAETLWTAIALHTTPGIPGRMAPEIATTHLGVLTDVIGFGLDELDRAQPGEILTARKPRTTP
jgi:hypothetical protein